VSWRMLRVAILADSLAAIRDASPNHTAEGTASQDMYRLQHLVPPSWRLSIRGSVVKTDVVVFALAVRLESCPTMCRGRNAADPIQDYY
jgi:hypothetical protein